MENLENKETTTAEKAAETASEKAAQTASEKPSGEVKTAEKSEKAEEKKDESGNFVGFVLLSEAETDMNALEEALKKELGESAEKVEVTDKENIFARCNGAIVTLALMPAPVPNGEAEHYARGNYMWREAEEAVKGHKGHIIVGVVGESDPISKGKLFVKAVCACLGQKNALALYTDGAVYQPRFYLDLATVMKDNVLPVLNWIWFGIYSDGTQSGIYTYGLKKFGKDELEVYAYGSNTDFNEIRNFTIDIANYVLEGDVTLKDGQTIGLTATQKCLITRSEGLALDGETLKIRYTS